MSDYALDLSFIRFPGETAPQPDAASSVFPQNVHISHFFSSKQDLFDLLIPYFVEGLQRREFCLWGVTAPLAVDEALGALDKALGGAEPYVRSGQLEIFDIAGLYGRSDFDAEEVRDAFLSKVDRQMKLGWAGFRCDGMTTGVRRDDWRNLLVYEGEVTRTLRSSVTAICSYDLNQMSTEEVLEIIRVHQATILKKGKEWRFKSTTFGRG